MGSACPAEEKGKYRDEIRVERGTANLEEKPWRPPGHIRRRAPEGICC
jgi:hypothetical protein